jgi:hypothetical protein
MDLKSVSFLLRGEYKFVPYTVNRQNKQNSGDLYENVRKERDVTPFS